MRSIIIRNFRCYEFKRMEFRRGINLLIGDNASGKTSLLRACNLVMNSFFSGYSDEYTKWKSAENDDFREIKTSEIQTDDLPINIEFQVFEDEFPDIQMIDGSRISLRALEILYNFGSSKYSIGKKSRKNSRNLIGGLKPLYDYSSMLQSNSHLIEKGEAIQRNALPLFAYFTTEDIHSVRKFDKEKSKFKKYPQKPSFGYFESFDCRGLLDCWLKRLLVLKEAKKGDTEIECVRKAVVSVLGPDGCNIIKDVDIRPNDGNVYFIYCDGREVRSDLLSDGYRRLVSIAVDISFRCALLNKVKFGYEAYKYTHGTVIIDEIDEHLHPELQVRILKALHDTFPKIQFIVSTHAPLVMSSVESNEDNVVYKLDYKNGEYVHTELNTYGLDANSVLEDNMDSVIRPTQIGELIKKVRDLIADKQIDEAKKIMSELENKTNPRQEDLVRLRAIIKRLEILGK